MRTEGHSVAILKLDGVVTQLATKQIHTVDAIARISAKDDVVTLLALARVESHVAVLEPAYEMSIVAIDDLPALREVWLKGAAVQLSKLLEEWTGKIIFATALAIINLLPNAAVYDSKRLIR